MPQLSGEQHPNWKGGISQAYARKKWREYYGGDPPRGCDIHHIDGDKTNNDKENLTLIKHSGHMVHHQGLRFGDKIYRDRSWMIQKYVVEKLSMQDTGELCGANSKTILRWLRKHGIQTRKFNPVEAGKRLIEKYGHPPRGENGHYLARVKILEGE